jgi:hypothetical protein
MANNAGAFVPSTNIWDVSEIYQATKDEKLQELLVRLYQNLNRLSLVINIKDSAYYVQEEFVNGQKYFAIPSTNSTTPQSPALRQVFRKTINFGALPNSATKSVVHGLSPTDSWTFTRIYATASDTVAKSYIPIPYASATANTIIELDVDATHVHITTSINYSSYTVVYVILEYIKT